MVGAVNIVDPYQHLLLHHHSDAVRAGMQSSAAQYIRFALAEHLAELEDNDDLEEPYTQGYRMGLRVAFIAAGGAVIGSEVDWDAVVEAGRG